MICTKTLLAVAAALFATHAVAATKAQQDKAADRCEVAVAETVERVRGKDAREVEFIGAKRVIAPAPQEELGVKGEGRYRRPDGVIVSFTYSCAYNEATGGTSGALFRETGSTRAGAAVEARAAEPDINIVSPEACESAIAANIKQKYPRVGRIAFGSDSRRLRPAANANTSLEGQGAVERAPGMNLVPFNYRCEFEPRGGRIVRAESTA